MVVQDPFFTSTFGQNAAEMLKNTPKQFSTCGVCPAQELMRMVREKDKKCCKNYKHGKRCKKCPKAK